MTDPEPPPTDAPKAPTVLIVLKHHRQIASWAKRCVGYGRGAVFAFLPDVLPAGSVRLIAPMNFTRRSSLQEQALLGGKVAHVALAMVESYDPDTQMVVVAHIRQRDPVCFTLSLHEPAAIHTQWP